MPALRTFICRHYGLTCTLTVWTGGYLPFSTPAYAREPHRTGSQHHQYSLLSADGRHTLRLYTAHARQDACWAIFQTIRWRQWCDGVQSGAGARAAAARPSASQRWRGIASPTASVGSCCRGGRTTPGHSAFEPSLGEQQMDVGRWLSVGGGCDRVEGWADAGHPLPPTRSPLWCVRRIWAAMDSGHAGAPCHALPPVQGVTADDVDLSPWAGLRDDRSYWDTNALNDITAGGTVRPVAKAPAKHESLTACTRTWDAPRAPLPPGAARGSTTISGHSHAKRHTRYGRRTRARMVATF